MVRTDDNNIMLENERLAISVKLFGGAFCSIFDKKNSIQLLWQGGENSWNSRDHVLFPFIGRRQDGYYTVDGERFEMGLHGFALNSEFSVEKLSDAEAVLLIKSSPETKRIYPFDFEMRVKYTLCGNSVSVGYEVKNTHGKEIYFSVGGHIGLNVDGTTDGEGNDDTDGNFIRFAPPIKKVYKLDGLFVGGKSECAPVSEFETSKRYFREKDTFIGITDGKCALTLEKRSGGKISITTDAPVLALWSNNKYGKFVCVEPWYGLPDCNPPRREIKDGELVNKLGKGGLFEGGYVLKVE